MNINGIEVRTYNGTQKGENYVFVLSKGQNAGKPSRQPFANSFAIECQDTEHAQLVFSVLYALHCAKAYAPEMRGTAIPFVTVGSFKDIFFRALAAVTSEKVIKTIKNIGLIRQTIDHKKKADEECDRLLREYSISIFRHILSQTRLPFRHNAEPLL